MHNSNVTRSGFIFATCSILLVSAAQLLIKTAALNIDFEQSLPLFDVALQLLLLPAFVVPFFSAALLYVLSVFLWVKALAHLPLSVAYPLLGLSYPLVYFGASAINHLAEPLSSTRSLGVGLILIGVIIASRESNPS